jgi:hypothetical protein
MKKLEIKRMEGIQGGDNWDNGICWNFLILASYPNAPQIVFDLFWEYC